MNLFTSNLSPGLSFNINDYVDRGGSGQVLSDSLEGKQVPELSSSFVDYLCYLCIVFVS